MTTPTKLPETIQASIHQDALSRVPSFFNATIREILNELLQNARRAGATRVEIATTRESMTVADDGQGMPDPRALLAFGQSGWDETTTMNEHPAGMGLYTLARQKKVTIRSRCRDGAAWQVNLSPDHFTGKLAAPVETLENRDGTTGTSITLEIPSSTIDIGGEIQAATRHYPIRVYHNGIRIENRDFLENATYIETWKGIRIGVFKKEETEMNFHGITVKNPRLPTIRDIEMNHWTVKTDVMDCPDLELTLPARKEVVETPFMNRLRTACRRAIYRAMAGSPEPVDVPKQTQDDARRLGVQMPDARPQLLPWKATTADHLKYWYGSREKPVPVDGKTTLVMKAHLETGDQQALARAASRNGVEERLMQSNDDLRGYRWYDELQHVLDVGITITEGSKSRSLKRMRQDQREPRSRRPDSITFTLRGGRKENPIDLSLPTDLVFQNEEEDYEGESIPLVTPDSDITVEELAETIVDAFFSPSEDHAEDSYETQEERHREASERTAMEFLLDEEETRRRQTEKALREHVVSEIPTGTSVTIHISQEERDTKITIKQD